ncbi:MAG: DUF4272 domain-containing protein [Armatimonadetes bacterium]|nr:DUF4272 domain-containing protein [Armatimonadota bacterium]
MMDTKVILQKSQQAARQAGFPDPAPLPLLEGDLQPRGLEDVISRCLCLHAVAAVSFGFDRRRALDWLEREELVSQLTPLEAAFIHGRGSAERFQVQVEALWALAWALAIVPRLDFGTVCSDDFVEMLPDLKAGAGGGSLRKQARLRPLIELVEALDLAYCLHWGIREAELRRKRAPGRVAPYVVEERRRALEWLLSDQEWDEVQLDT